MEELGRKFKQRREELGIELSTAREETNIRLDYLKAIEAGDFDRIEAEVYLKGFLKVYSDYLDLNTEAIMEEYEQLKTENQQTEEDMTQEERTARDRLGEFVDKHQNLLLGLFVSGLILILVVGLIYLGTVAYQQFKKRNAGHKIQKYISNLAGNSAQKQSEKTNKETTDTANSPSESIQDQQSSISSNDQSGKVNESSTPDTANKSSAQSSPVSDLETNVNQANRTKKEQPRKDKPSIKKEKQPEKEEKRKINQGQEQEKKAVNQKIASPEVNQQKQLGVKKKIAVQVKTVAESWYLVQVNNQVAFRGLVPPGTAKQFSGRKIKIRIGNAAGVKIIKENQTLGPFGEKGEIVTKVFTVQTSKQQE